MNRRIWLPRIAAAVLLTGLVGCAAAGLAIADDLAAVDSARSRLPAPTPVPSIPWTRPLPALRVGRGEPRAAVGEFLDGQLSRLGIEVLTLETPSVRPLGDGLRLVEVTVTGRGAAGALEAVAAWAAMNHQAVRLKSLQVASEADGQGRITLSLLVVVA